MSVVGPVSWVERKHQAVSVVPNRRAVSQLVGYVVASVPAHGLLDLRAHGAVVLQRLLAQHAAHCLGQLRQHLVQRDFLVLVRGVLVEDLLRLAGSTTTRAGAPSRTHFFRR